MFPRITAFPATETLSKLPDRGRANMTEKQLDALAGSPVQGRLQFGSRAALFAGFGTLLILMAIISIDSL
jgi:hypothetical protein